MAHEGSHHDEAGAHDKSKSADDNCCNDQVIKFFKVNKSLSQCFAGINVIFFTALISSFHNNDVLDTSKALANVKYFVRASSPRSQV